MKISPVISPVNERLSTLYLRGKYYENHASNNVEIKQVSVKDLGDYRFASEYYNHNLNNNGQMFDIPQLLQEALQDEKAQKTMFIFFRARAEQELAQLMQKQNLSAEEKDKMVAMREIIQAFPSQNQLVMGQYSQPVSFGGIVTSEQKKKCHLIIHGASLACAGISAAMGEGAAVGADTWLLRGTQAIMFLSLQRTLGVAHVPSLLYMGKQYSMGAYIGVRGAQYLISWLGLGGHAASGGTASAPVTSAVRGVNATLSTAITEKMGWGYVKNYENDTMNTKTQLINTGIYAVTLGLFKVFPGAGVLDTDNPEDIQSAIEKLPKDKVATLGKAMYFLSENIHLSRLGIIFATSLLQGAIMTQNMDEKSTKEYFKNLIKISLLNTVLYEVFNFIDANEVTKEATETIKALGEQIAKDPEISQELTKAQQEIINSGNLDKMNSHDFVKQFQDREFLYNLAIMTSETSYLLADKWRKRNHAAIKAASDKVNKDIKNTNARTNLINGKMSAADISNMEKNLKDLLQKTRERMNSEARSDFGLNRVAGYDAAVVAMKYCFVDPVKNNDTNSIPNLVLFYGPSGVGKTLIGQAASQSAGARYKARTMSTREDRDLQKIKDFVEDAKRQNRHTVIQLNEFEDSFVNDPKLMNEFLALVKDCAKNSNVTFFLTTNNPLLIDDRILKQAQIKLPMGPAERQEIREIVKYYAGQKDIEGFDIERVVDEFERVKPDRAYNNTQIEEILTLRLPKNNPTMDDVIKLIRQTNPVIRHDIIKKFEEEKSEFGYKGV